MRNPDLVEHCAKCFTGSNQIERSDFYLFVQRPGLLARPFLSYVRIVYLMARRENPT